jgi:hypothetical protein
MIFFAGSYSSLLAVTESLLVLLYPFFWQHVYIPVLPASMHGVLEAPLPYIVGLHSSKLAKVLEDLGTPHDLVYIDIEKDQLLGGGFVWRLIIYINIARFFKAGRSVWSCLLRYSRGSGVGFARL